MFLLLRNRSQVVFDIDNEGKPRYFHDLWNSKYKLERHEDFLELSPVFLGFALPFLILAHLIVSWFLHRRFYYRDVETKENVGGEVKKVLEGVWTLVCSPTYLDWDSIWHLMPEKISIAECWERSWKLALGFNILIFAENMVMMVPLVVLKMAIGRRDTFLGEDFPPTSDENYSAHMVNSLLICGYAYFCALPFVSMLLIIIYFKRFHAWSRILKNP